MWEQEQGPKTDPPTAETATAAGKSAGGGAASSGWGDFAGCGGPKAGGQRPTPAADGAHCTKKQAWQKCSLPALPALPASTRDH